nr:uncharacterized protein LOC127301461 isoform X7 [Lolium perenne]
MGLGIRAVEESCRRRGFRGAREALFLLRRPRAKAKFMGMNGWAGSLVRCKIVCRNSVCKTMWQTMRSCTKMIFGKQPWATKRQDKAQARQKSKLPPTAVSGSSSTDEAPKATEEAIVGLPRHRERAKGQYFVRA